MLDGLLDSCTADLEDEEKQEIISSTEEVYKILKQYKDRNVTFFKSDIESIYQSCIEKIAEKASIDLNEDINTDYSYNEVKIALETKYCIDEDVEILAAAIIAIYKKNNASISTLQRELSIGFARSSILIDKIESLGIIGVYNGSKPHDIIIRYSDLVDAIS